MLRLSDFDYALPEEAIAQNPVEPRDSSRLMEVRDRGIAHHRFSDLADLLEPGDIVVLNNTRVTARRLLGERETGGKVEALLLRDLGDGAYEALMRPAKKLRAGEDVLFEDGVSARIEAEGEEGIRTLRFAEPEKVAGAGSVPLPPYIRSTLAADDRYQTIYASAPGSSAAPTAGLHFTDDVFARLREKGIATAFVTLDVGIDTFRPVQSERVEDHKMHGERFAVPAETRDAVRNVKGRVVAVGTTTARALETASIGNRQLRAGDGCSSIFIRPGHEFKTVDALLTNFHMPRTTMLFMVAALCGRETLMQAYEAALSSGYRFLSFGDSMLVFGRQNGEKHA